MILEFYVNNSWCYEEAEQIRWVNVWIDTVTKDYKEGGERWKLLQNKLENGFDDGGLDVEFATEMQNAVDNLIRKKTNCSDEVVYYVDLQISKPENVYVVTLCDRNKNITYVFDKDVYLLNNRGQTVQKIA